MIEAGQPIDVHKELELANVDDAIAEAQYTQDAIDRVNTADDQLETLTNGQ